MGKSNKRQAEDNPEEVLIVKSPKKQRIEGSDEMETPVAASPVRVEAASPTDKKEKKKQKKKNKEKREKQEANLEKKEQPPTPTKAASPSIVPATASASNGVPTEGATALEKQQKKLAKKQRKEQKKQQIAVNLNQAQRDVFHKGEANGDGQKRLKKLERDNQKAKKEHKKIPSKPKSTAVDTDALRKQIRLELLEEMRQYEGAILTSKSERTALNHRPRMHQAKLAAQAAEGQAQAMDVDQAEADDNDEEAAKETDPETPSKGLVHTMSSQKGFKPTSDSLQMAQLDAALARIDLSQLSASVQAKIRQLQALDWRLSDPAGGRMLRLEPIFSPNETSIMIAYPSSVRIYSTKTSLLLRTLDLTEGHITAMTLSTDGSRLYVGSDTGSLDQWDWVAGEKTSSFTTDSPIHHLSQSSRKSSGETDRIYAIHSMMTDSKSTWTVHIHKIDLSNNTLSSKTILESPDKLTKSISLCSDKALIVAAGQRVNLGSLRSNDKSDLSSVEFVWYDIDCPDLITSIDAYETTSSKPDFHMAIGASGPIFLYRNLLSQAQSGSKNKSSAKSAPQKLHWHRYPVGDVKFSKDGNYLISGGFETVLCKWQLDTGKREDLPHLTAPIEKLVVSPNGASYAVSLGNNSLKIVSTLDSGAKFAVSGIALPALLDTPTKGLPVSRSYPATHRPHSTPPQILLATPASTSDGSPMSAVYLQTVDARTGTQLEKQALTRTNVTDRVSNPQGKILGEPSVKQMATSHDGRWLATAEQWRPPPVDLDFVADNIERSAVSKARRETYLKFWSRNDDENNWQLSSRIDSAHSEELTANGKILDLISEEHGFITAGSEGVIKVWRQHDRVRNGMPIKRKSGESLVGWHCVRSITMSSPPVVDDTQDTLVAAKLALAADSTLLVAVYKYRRSTIVCLVNYSDGSAITSRSDLPIEVLVGAAVVDQYLVILSESVIVWDLIQDRLQYAYRLKVPSQSLQLWLSFTHLASHKTGTFAIAVPGDNYESSEIVVFGPDSVEPRVTRTLSSVVRSLVAVDGSEDFLAVDAMAQLRRLRAPQSTIQSIVALPIDSAESDEDEPVESQTSLQLGNLPLRAANAQTEDARQAAQRSSRSDALYTQASLAELSESINPLAQGSTLSFFEKVVGFKYGHDVQKTSA